MGDKDMKKQREGEEQRARPEVQEVPVEADVFETEYYSEITDPTLRRGEGQGEAIEESKTGTSREEDKKKKDDKEE